MERTKYQEQTDKWEIEMKINKKPVITVKSLIEHLQTLDPNLLVTVVCDGCCTSIDAINVKGSIVYLGEDDSEE